MSEAKLCSSPAEFTTAPPVPPSWIDNPVVDEMDAAKPSPSLSPAQASVAVWVNEGGEGGEVKR